MPQVLANCVCVVLRWLGTVLQRSVHYLRTMVRHLELSGRKRQKKSHETARKLGTLKDRANGVIKRLFEEMEESVNDICGKVINNRFTFYCLPCFLSFFANVFQSTRVLVVIDSHFCLFSLFSFINYSYIVLLVIGAATWFMGMTCWCCLPLFKKEKLD